MFEEFLKKLFSNESIKVTEPFKIVGEQIDGSIKYDGEHYIIEAKWHDKCSASDSLLRTILVDGGDLVPITEGMYTLKDMLDNKIKAAQTMGRIYVDSTNLADKVVQQ